MWVTDYHPTKCVKQIQLVRDHERKEVVDRAKEQLEHIKKCVGEVEREGKACEVCGTKSLVLEQLFFHKVRMCVCKQCMRKIVLYSILPDDSRKTPIPKKECFEDEEIMEERLRSLGYFG